MQHKMTFAKTILSLCDYSGTWSQPYLDAGYDVVRIDLKNGSDVRLLKLPGKEVYGILAAPPCTHFAIAGAPHWKKKGDRELIKGLSIVDACLRLALICKPVFWCLENPRGRLARYIGKPTMTFQPFEFGDPYTKFTCLWGEFCTELEQNVVQPVGSLMDMAKGAKEVRRANRSVTPKGFAEAFFKANQ